MAKSTHAGIPWLRYIVEVYPALWSRSFVNEGRSSDQHGAFSIAAWLSRADQDGSLANFLKPELTPPERGVSSLASQPERG